MFLLVFIHLLLLFRFYFYIFKFCFAFSLLLFCSNFSIYFCICWRQHLKRRKNRKAKQNIKSEKKKLIYHNKQRKTVAKLATTTTATKFVICRASFFCYKFFSLFFFWVFSHLPKISIRNVLIFNCYCCCWGFINKSEALICIAMRICVTKMSPNVLMKYFISIYSSAFSLLFLLLVKVVQLLTGFSV